MRNQRLDKRTDPVWRRESFGRSTRTGAPDACIRRRSSERRIGTMGWNRKWPSRPDQGPEKWQSGLPSGDADRPTCPDLRERMRQDLRGIARCAQAGAPRTFGSGGQPSQPLDFRQRIGKRWCSGGRQRCRPPLASRRLRWRRAIPEAGISAAGEFGLCTRPRIVTRPSAFPQTREAGPQPRSAGFRIRRNDEVGSGRPVC